MNRYFETLKDFNTYTENGTRITAGDLYFIKEEKMLFKTNNIDGTMQTYDMAEPSGNIEITENGEDINIAPYASATVNVPIPEGYIIPTGNKTITQNGTNIDVNDYATATVAVPQPSGNIELTENGEGINIAQYATATVNVAGSAKDYIIEGAVYDPTATYSGGFDIKAQIVTANIPNGFTSIGYEAFRNSSRLTSITIPNSVTSIGNTAFFSCTRLTSISIPDSVTSIGSQAFQSCSGLTSVTIGSGVTSIGNSAFANCSSLTSIVVDSGNTVYDSRDNCNAIINTSTNELIVGCKNTVIPNTVTSIGNRAFDGCSGLRSLTIPSSVTSIGQNVFYNCSGLRSLTIPSSVTSIGNWAFYYCSGLTSVTIGSGVTSIGNDAFNLCRGLTSVTIEATTPPTLGTSAFDSTNNCQIYVPAASVDAYKAATNWSSYASRIQAIA